MTQAQLAACVSRAPGWIAYVETGRARRSRWRPTWRADSRRHWTRRPWRPEEYGGDTGRDPGELRRAEPLPQDHMDRLAETLGTLPHVRGFTISPAGD